MLVNVIISSPNFFKHWTARQIIMGMDGDEVGWRMRRERITFPKLSQSLSTYLQVHHLTMFYILLERAEVIITRELVFNSFRTLRYILWCISKLILKVLLSSIIAELEQSYRVKWREWVLVCSYINMGWVSVMKAWC